MRLVSDWKSAHKWLSMHAATFGILVSTVLEFYGDQVDPIWFTGLFVLVIIARVVSQDE